MTSSIPTADEINAMTDQQRKVLENRLRRAAERQGLRLEKSRVRDPRALVYGTYQLVDIRTNSIAWADWALQRGYGLDLEDVARYLFGPRAAIHIDYSPEHEGMTFDDTNGEPIVSYHGSSTGARNDAGRRIPDGWVLSYLERDGNGVEEYVTGIRDLAGVDQAIALSQDHLSRLWASPA